MFSPRSSFRSQSWRQLVSCICSPPRPPPLCGELAPNGRRRKRQTSQLPTQSKRWPGDTLTTFLTFFFPSHFACLKGKQSKKAYETEGQGGQLNHNYYPHPDFSTAPHFRPQQTVTQLWVWFSTAPVLGARPPRGAQPGCRRASAHPCPRPGPQPRTASAPAAGRASSYRSQAPAARAAAAASGRARGQLSGAVPSGPTPPQTGSTKEYGDGEYKEPSHTPKGLGDFPRGRTTSPHKHTHTRTRPARAGEGISYLSPRRHSSLPPPQVWLPPRPPPWVPSRPLQAPRTHCVAARAQRLQGPAAAAAAETETAAAAAAAAAAPAGVSQTGAAKPHRPY